MTLSWFSLFSTIQYISSNSDSARDARCVYNHVYGIPGPYARCHVASTVSRVVPGPVCWCGRLTHPAYSTNFPSRIDLHLAASSQLHGLALCTFSYRPSHYFVRAGKSLVNLIFTVSLHKIFVWKKNSLTTIKVHNPPVKRFKSPQGTSFMSVVDATLSLIQNLLEALEISHSEVKKNVTFITSKKTNWSVQSVAVRDELNLWDELQISIYFLFLIRTNRNGEL